MKQYVLNVSLKKLGGVRITLYYHEGAIKGRVYYPSRDLSAAIYNGRFEIAGNEYRVVPRGELPCPCEVSRLQWVGGIQGEAVEVPTISEENEAEVA